jgi:hypothetical protein
VDIAEARGRGLVPLSTFLQSACSSGRYVITQLPEPMGRDVLVPPSFLCGARHVSVHSAVWHLRFDVLIVWDGGVAR